MRRILALLVLPWILAACAIGPNVHIKGGLSRPVREGGTRPARGAERVAVRDFSEAFPPSREVGRDFDHVRSIVWEGSPGKSIADLVAAALEEKGVGALRIAPDAEIPDGIALVVSGRIEEFRVDARRATAIRVEMTARVALGLEVAGSPDRPGWKSSVSSEYQVADLFVTPVELRNALNGASNGIADEAARRLLAEVLAEGGAIPR